MHLPPHDEIPFAFGGRVSTEDQQDPESSYQWQLRRARALIEPHGGVIVAEYFDIGHSRAARCLGQAGSWLRGGGHRRAAAGLLRQPVQPHLPAVHPLRRALVGARGRRPHRPRIRSPRPGDDPVRQHVEGRAPARQDPRARRHAGPSARPGPLPGRPAPLRLPARRRRPPPQPRQGPPRRPPAPSGTRPGHRTRRGAHLRAVSGRARLLRHRGAAHQSAGSLALWL